ncbi:MAG: 5-deoxy-glucuronate isomerase [Solirubrobacteraceae bacterium]|jgi:5-deoxy-glucuronate isomerase
MSDLIVKPAAQPAADGTLLAVTPMSAGWSYVGLEILRLGAGVTARRDTGDREVCVVVLGGTVDISSIHGEWSEVGGRPTPFDGMPEAAYLPPQTAFSVTRTAADEDRAAQVALCFAPASTGAAAGARLLPGSAIVPETRGSGASERVVHPILMTAGTEEAQSLLVTEVLTPAGNWSSYPPHKHDRDALPDESYLEETYYHRVDPPQGFVVQRVYTDDRSLDQTLAVGDGEVVLVPRGYHPVGAPAGYRSYYLNVMAGPHRTWVFHNDPDHEWLLGGVSPGLGTR